MRASHRACQYKTGKQLRKDGMGNGGATSRHRFSRKTTYHLPTLVPQAMVSSLLRASLALRIPKFLSDLYCFTCDICIHCAGLRSEVWASKHAPAGARLPLSRIPSNSNSQNSDDLSNTSPAKAVSPSHFSPLCLQQPPCLGLTVSQGYN